VNGGERPFHVARGAVVRGRCGEENSHRVSVPQPTQLTAQQIPSCDTTPTSVDVTDARLVRTMNTAVRFLLARIGLKLQGRFVHDG
jgi:hypothetical protein